MPPRVWLLAAFRGWGAKAIAPAGPRQLKTGVVLMNASISEIWVSVMLYPEARMGSPFAEGRVRIKHEFQHGQSDPAEPDRDELGDTDWFFSDNHTPEFIQVWVWVHVT